MQIDKALKISVIVSILAVAASVSYYFLLFLPTNKAPTVQSENNSLATEIYTAKEQVSPAVEEPPIYRASALQIGGEGSYLVNKSAGRVDEHAYLNPPEDYIKISFNGPGDIMWANCRDGYKVTDATSTTGNEVSRDEDLGANILIQNNTRNSLVIICTKQ